MDTWHHIRKLLEIVFSIGSCRSCIRRTNWSFQSGVASRGGGLEHHRSPASGRRRRKKNPAPGGYNWATLFLGYINTGIWPSRLGESRIWDSKMWSWVPRNSDPRMTALTTASSSYKWQIRPLVREGSPHQQTRNCLTVIKIWSWASDGCLTPRQIGRHNFDFDFDFQSVENLRTVGPMG
jgi:hypothetical protein